MKKYFEGAKDATGTTSVEGLLKAWVDGELPPPMARRVGEYVDGSAQARAVVADYRQLSLELSRAAKRLPVPEEPTLGVLLGARRRAAAERRMVAVLKRLSAVAAVFLVCALAMLAVAKPVAPADGGEGRATANEIAGETGKHGSIDTAQAIAWAIDDHPWLEDWR